MSQPAQKRTVVPPAPPPAALADKTGRFRRAGATVLPPPGAAPDVVSPEEVGAQLEPDLDAEQADRGVTSGVFGKAGAPTALADADLAAFADSLIPYYREGDRQSERAQLEVEKLGPPIDNPFAGSSLVPPSRTSSRAIPKRALLGIGIGAVALAGAFALGWSRGVERDAVRATQLAPRTAPAAVAAPVARTEEPRAAAAVELSSSEPVSTAPEAVAAPVAAAPKAEKVAAPIAAVPARAPEPAALPPEPAAPTPAPAAAAAPAAAPTPVAAGATAVAEPAAESEVTPEAAAVALPELPTRAEVAAGFDAVRGALQTCAAGKHGVIDIDATVSGSGRVTYALIAGVFKGSPEGSCMARAVRAARFPQFSRASLKVSYPIAL